MNNIQLDDLPIRYDNNLYNPSDIFGDGNCLYSSLLMINTIFLNN